jgi:hypothetical protein
VAFDKAKCPSLGNPTAPVAIHPIKQGNKKGKIVQVFNKKILYYLHFYI